MRRWRVLVATGATVLSAVLISPRLWLEWIQFMLEFRATVMFTPHGNVSLANSFLYAGQMVGFGTEFLKQTADLLWLMLLGHMFWTDFNNMPRANPKTAATGLVFYFPFMVAVPDLVHPYGIVCFLMMLPAISWQWQNATSAPERNVLLLIIIGAALAQFHSHTAYFLYHAGTFQNQVPGFGLLIAIIGITVYKAKFLYQPKPA